MPDDDRKSCFSLGKEMQRLIQGIERTGRRAVKLTSCTNDCEKTFYQDAPSIFTKLVNSYTAYHAQAALLGCIEAENLQQVPWTLTAPDVVNPKLGLHDRQIAFEDTMNDIFSILARETGETDMSVHAGTSGLITVTQNEGLPEVDT